jgi:large conductance mechanosensitive channel
MSGFKKFLLRGNVIDLAVGIVIGAAFTSVINALVKDIITPIIGIFGGLPDFSTWSFTINGSKFMIGDFINNVIAFVIMALIVYFVVVLPFQAFMDRVKGPPPEAAPTTRDCPYCLSKIPKAAKKCAFCTADVPPETA